MSDDTGNGGVLGFETKAGVAGGLDQRGLYTVDPVTGERCYGDGAMTFAVAAREATERGAQAAISLAAAEEKIGRLHRTLDDLELRRRPSPTSAAS